jgi:hypothetical protein
MNTDNQTSAQLMKITITTSSYNEKRFGKPYVAKLDTNGNVVEWGQWIGTPGDEGFLEIECALGDVVMHGQKDYRGNKGRPDYALVLSDGSLQYMTKADAVRAAREIESSAGACA